jgi:hypothetical protein
MQARLAAEHGKAVWLIHSLVTHQEWARKMVAAGRAVEVHRTSEVIDDLESPDDVLVDARAGTLSSTPVWTEETLEFGL